MSPDRRKKQMGAPVKTPGFLYLLLQVCLLLSLASDIISSDADPAGSNDLPFITSQGRTALVLFDKPVLVPAWQTHSHNGTADQKAIFLKRAPPV